MKSKNEMPEKIAIMPKDLVVVMSTDVENETSATLSADKDEDEVESELSERSLKPAWKDDIPSIFLLLYLYVLQGVPIGLISAIPLVLHSKGVTYSEQAIFSFASWPFSLKLLWAPIVDAVYCKRLGRRKSWTVPCQYLIGLFLLVISYFSGEILGTTDCKPPNVALLMSMFLVLNFLAATQDIAVDGWALTMLARKNVGYASTCNVVGQTTGYFLGHVVFLTLQSKDFANTWFRSVPQESGIIGFGGFVFFWGWVFIVSTTLIWLLKKEVDNSEHNRLRDLDNEELSLGVFDTYVVLTKILCLKPILYMAFVLLTAKIAFSATDGITDLKLIAAGVTTDKIASRLIFMAPLQIVLPWVLSKKTAGSKPLSVYLWAYPYRIVVGLMFATLIYWTPSLRDANGEYSYVFYVTWVVAYHFHQIAHYCIFLSTMAFFAKISDPKVGGTYMTLLNTLNNLGGNWPITLFLTLTDLFNKKDCLSKDSRVFLQSCSAKAAEDLCNANGNSCEWIVDGYYVSVAICTIVGMLWYRFFFRRVQYFQRLPCSAWRVIRFKRSSKTSIDQL